MSEPVAIPRDPEARRKLAEFAGLTQEERDAIEQWCALEQRGIDARRRRGLERHGNAVLGGPDAE